MRCFDHSFLLWRDNCDFFVLVMHQKSLAFNAEQTVVGPAQSFWFNVFYNADILCCASFPFWEIGAFVLLKLKCRGPPSVSKSSICITKITGELLK